MKCVDTLEMDQDAIEETDVGMFMRPLKTKVQSTKSEKKNVGTMEKELVAKEEQIAGTYMRTSETQIF